MKRALSLGIAVVGLAAVAVWLYFSPYLAVNGLKQAATAQDASAVAGYVDFPSVQNSLKTALGAKVSQATAAAPANPLFALGAALGTALVNPLVDALVTPEGLALLFQGSIANAAPLGLAASAGGVPVTTMGYEDVNTFVVSIQKGGVPAVGLVFNRSALLSWKLSAIRLP